MSWLDGLRHRLRPLLHPQEWQRELDEEVRLHLELEAAQRRGGTDARLADREAHLSFGAVTYYREETRRMTLLGALDVLRQDVRYGWRALVRSPAFTITAVLSLALGIGANTAVFGLMYAVLLEPLPLPRPDRLVGVQRITDNPQFAHLGPFSVAELAAMRQARGVRLAASTGLNNLSVVAAGQRDVSNVELVDGAYFGTLQLQPVAGRLVGPDDDREARPVVVISDQLWERWFNRDPDAVGTTITLQGASFTVIGVAPRAYQGLVFPGVFALAVPLSAGTLIGLPDIHGPHGTNVQVIGRLADRAALEVESANLAALFDRCCANGELASGQSKRITSPSQVSLVDISHGIPFAKIDLRGDYGRVLLILMAGVSVVLLIACANVGNLLLARATARSRELAVRLALGASRGRIVRQLLTESVLLAVLGGALGVLFAWWATNVIVRNMPGSLTDFPDLIAFHPKPVLLAFTVGVSIACVLVFGLVPALRATRTDLVTPLKEGGAGRVGKRTGLLDRSIVVAQVALALLLVSAAGLLGATLRNLRGVDPGFATTRVLLVTVETRGTSREREGIVPVHAELLERVRRIPGVQSAAMSMNSPVYGGRTTTRPIDVPGSDAPSAESTDAILNPVTPGYFEAAGMTLRSGRDFSTGDGAGASKVVVISETVAKRHFAGRDPIGRQITLGRNSAVSMTIVGVVRDAKYRNLRGDAEPLLYVPIEQETTGTWPFVVVTARTIGSLPAIAEQIRREIAGVGGDLRILRLQRMEQAMDASLARERLAAGLATVFAALALGLAVVGLYGVVSYNVARRSVEIGVRMALGAQSRDVVWYVLRGSVTLVAVGVLLGAPLTFIGGKVVAALLFGVGAHDPLLLTGAALLLACAAVAASAIPAARAARIDPLRALRQG